VQIAYLAAHGFLPLVNELTLDVTDGEILYTAASPDRLVGVTLHLEGESITRISFEYAVLLLTDAASVVRINTELRINSPQVSLSVDPEQVSEGAHVVLTMLHRSIRSSNSNDDGALSLELDGDVLLEVPPSDEYEAWEVTRADGSRVVCMPGGALAEWGPTSV
jgi:hypothetical protein